MDYLKLINEMRRGSPRAAASIIEFKPSRGFELFPSKIGKENTFKKSGSTNVNFSFLAPKTSRNLR